MNITYRDNQELVALDFAYIYRVIGNELVCDACDVKPMLEYTPDYDKLTCPHCRKQFLFMDVRRRISKEMETRELEMSKERAYVITNQVQEVELNEADIEVTDFSQEDKTYKFNLGDYITYRNREEAIEMLNEKERLERQKQETGIDSFINLNYDPVEEAQDELLDEVERMMSKKRGYVSPNKPIIGLNHEDDEPEYDEEQLRRENEKLSSLIAHMTGYGDDEEEEDEYPCDRNNKEVKEQLDEDDEPEQEFQEASDDEMIAEIERMRKHDEIIYLNNGPVEEDEQQEDTKTLEEIVTEAVIEEANKIAPEKLKLSSTYGEWDSPEVSVQPLTEEERAILKTPNEELEKIWTKHVAGESGSKSVFIPIDEGKLEQTEKEIPIKEVIRKCPGRKLAAVRLKSLMERGKKEAIEEEVIPQPKEVSFQMMLDSEIDNTIMIDPVSDEENNLKMDIQQSLIRYLHNKGIDMSNLDLAIDVSFVKKYIPENETDEVESIEISYGDEEEIEIKIESDEQDASVIIDGQPITIGGAVDYDKMDQEEIQKMIALYGNLEEDGEPISEEDLEELYRNN